MDLPTGQFDFYAGVDPGFTGAIGLINAAGTVVRVWDMPITYKTDGQDRTREIDLPGVDSVFKSILALPNSTMGIEWPTTRPGEGAERMERFGRGKGILQTMAYCRGLDYHLISPILWKGRLGIPGKSDSEANKIAARMFCDYYPGRENLIYGSRGGVKSGRVDALMIAHFLRTRSIGNMKTIVEQFGRDSPQAMAMILRSAKPGRRRKNRKK